MNTTPLTDEAREEAIKQAGKAVEASMQVWDREGCFAARGEAERQAEYMRDLIKARSAAQVAKMEQARGLV